MPEVSKTNELQGKRKKQMGRKQETSLFKKMFRFLFIGFWESTYRRKKQRLLFSYRASIPPPKRDQYVYYPRYQWIRRGKEGAPGQI
jgi:hypothetical protein